jgi:hypothetical protein
MRSSKRIAAVCVAVWLAVVGLCFQLSASFVSQSSVAVGAALIGSGVSAQSSDGNSSTTAGYNVTGAKLIVVGTGGIGGTGTITDSAGNTYTDLTVYTSSSAVKSKLAYKINPTAGAGQTFTSTGTTFRPSTCVLAFTAITGFDTGKDSGFGQTGGGTTSIQPGSLTASVANSVMITMLAYNTAISGITVDSGYVSPPQISAAQSGTSIGCSLTYQVLSAAVAKNPLWSWAGAATAATGQAIFQASAPVSGSVLSPASKSWISQ